MKLKSFVALGVVFALVGATAAVAGPSRPAGGDPDIWDRAKPPVNSQPRPVTYSVDKIVDVDFAVLKISVRLPGATSRATIEQNGLPIPSRDLRTR